MSVFESLKPKCKQDTDMKYSDLFHKEKPVFGMLHLSTPQGMTLLELAKRETEIYLRHGIHPLIENYFGSHEDCATVLKSDGAIVGSWFKEEHDASGVVNEQHVAAFMKAWNGV